MSDASDERRPVLRVISGGATEEAIAAVLAVVLASTGDGAVTESDEASVWATPGSRHRGVRGVFAPGRDGWRTSYWPR